MSISVIYRVSHTLPNALDNYLDEKPSENHTFELALINIQEYNCGSGANRYSDREEWAEFETEKHAIDCDNAMRKLITDWHNKAIQAGY